MYKLENYSLGGKRKNKTKKTKKHQKDKLNRLSNKNVHKFKKQEYLQKKYPRLYPDKLPSKTSNTLFNINRFHRENDGTEIPQNEWANFIGNTVGMFNSHPYKNVIEPPKPRYVGYFDLVPADLRMRMGNDYNYNAFENNQ